MNWINVKDKLPECGAYVLVCCTIKVTSKIDYVNAVTMAFVCEEGFVDVELDEVITEGVTHWMPLPEPRRRKNNACKNRRQILLLCQVRLQYK